jgi:DNA-binding NarL/FixJ family response regulator
MKIRALIADDHGVVLEGLRHILEDAGCDVVGAAEDGREAVRLAETLHPDLLVLDISMPGLNGIEAARQIRRADPHVRLLFLSMHSDAVYVREAFRAGGNGYLLKRSAVSELAPAIREVMQGRYYVTPLVTKQTIAHLLGGPGGGNFGRDLTPRQREVLQLVAEGKTAKEAAAILNLSVKTIEFHKNSIMDSLGLRTIAELTRYAMGHKMVDE